MSKQMIPEALRLALRHLNFELKAIRNHKKSIKEARKYNGKLLKLHIGCGPILKSGWVNIDLTNED